jgi:hypothetical protein
VFLPGTGDEAKLFKPGSAAFSLLSLSLPAQTTTAPGNSNVFMPAELAAGYNDTFLHQPDHYD